LASNVSDIDFSGGDLGGISSINVQELLKEVKELRQENKKLRRLLSSSRSVQKNPYTKGNLSRAEQHESNLVSDVDNVYNQL